MFEGFALDEIDVGEAVLRVRHGGSGPAGAAVARTPAHAHDVAPGVAASCRPPTPWSAPTCAATGKSSKPLTTDDHEPYSKRAMARDCVALMRELGHSRFAVVGHDRGGYVAMRLALDEPDAVTALVVLDIVPIGEALARCNAEFAERWYHWFFLAQPAARPERAISAHPDAWYGGRPERMGVANWDDRRQAIHDPETVHAMCEDYRAGLGLDRAADDADRAAGRTDRLPDARALGRGRRSARPLRRRARGLASVGDGVARARRWRAATRWPRRSPRIWPPSSARSWCSRRSRCTRSVPRRPRRAPAASQRDAAERLLDHALAGQSP